MTAADVAERKRRRRRRQRLGVHLDGEIATARIGKKGVAEAMGISKTGLNNILSGFSSMTPEAAVRFAAVIEDAHLRVVGGPFEIERVQRRARDYLSRQLDIDLSEAVGSSALATVLGRLERLKRRRRRKLAPVDASVYAAAIPRGPDEEDAR